MFRDGQEVANASKGYGGNHDVFYFREKKSDNYDKEGQQIKAEINKCRRQLIPLAKRTDTESVNLFQKISEDLYFWRQEMSSKNFASHKRLKRKTKKIPYDKLKNLVLEIIDEAKENNKYFLRKEDVAYRLQVKVSDLDKIFMELNREGILSQAKHEYMHDTNRGGYPLYPWESSDWAADIYYILK